MRKGGGGVCWPSGPLRIVGPLLLWDRGEDRDTCTSLSGVEVGVETTTGPSQLVSSASVLFGEKLRRRPTEEARVAREDNIVERSAT